VHPGRCPASTADAAQQHLGRFILKLLQSADYNVERA
jgi:hypothetical protein